MHMVIHSQTNTAAIDHQVRGAVAFTADVETFAAASWVLSTRAAYNGTILLTNGTVLQAKRRQRPHIVFKAAVAANAYTNVTAKSTATGWQVDPKPTPYPTAGI